jgi:hypothetical protein
VDLQVGSSSGQLLETRVEQAFPVSANIAMPPQPYEVNELSLQHPVFSQTR